MKKTNDVSLFARYISDFLHDYAPSFLTQSNHTLKSYKDTLTLYIRFLEHEGITPATIDRHCFERACIEKWIQWMINDRSCCRDTCNVRLGSLRVFLNFIGGKNISLLYLFQESKLIKRQKCVKKKVNGLSREAVQAILAAPDFATKTGRRDFTLLMLLYGTAARIGEILSLRVEHVHLDGNKPYAILHGKGGKIRTAYLLPRIKYNLKEYILEFHGHEPNSKDFLFYSRNGTDRGMLTEAAVDRRIKKYASAAQKTCNPVPVKAHAHQFRHAKATHLLEDGINIVQISFILGHENIETTMKYLDITDAEKIKALQTIEAEGTSNTQKQWKNANGTLSDYFGLTR